MSVVTTRPCSVRQAAELAGVTRATARAVVEVGLVPSQDLQTSDVVALRAVAASRSLLFPGESQPANRERTARQRDIDLVAAVRQLFDAGERGELIRGAYVMVFPGRVQVASDQGSMVVQVISAVNTGEPFLSLPVGQWVANAREGRPIAG